MPDPAGWRCPTRPSAGVRAPKARGRSRVAEHHDRPQLAVLTELREVRAVAAVFPKDPHKSTPAEAVVGLDRCRELDPHIDAFGPTGLKLGNCPVEGVDANDLVLDTLL